MFKEILDLMDWKNVEQSGEESIRRAEVAIALDDIMVRHAKREILRLGGKTSEEEKKRSEAKKSKDLPTVKSNVHGQKNTIIRPSG